MNRKIGPRRERIAPALVAFTLWLLAGNVAQAQTADDINAAILTNLGLADAAEGHLSTDGQGPLSADHKSGLADFIARTRVFADDLDRALRAETVPEERSPRETAENPLLADLHALLPGMDQDQLINPITGYTPQADTAAALMRAFAPVLPPRLGARRAELEAEFSTGFDSVLEFSLPYKHRNSISFVLESRVAEYWEIIAKEGIYSAIITLFDEIDIPPVEAIEEPQFYALFDAFSQARARGDYSGDDADYFVEDVIGFYQTLYEGDDVRETYRSLITPMLDEGTAQLHPRLMAVYLSQLERARVSAEAERVSAEAEAARETARAIREMLGVTTP